MRLLALALVIVGTTGCDSLMVTRGRVIGEYFDQVRNDGSLSLTLRDDGTYLQRERLSGGAVLEDKGRWEFSFTGQTVLLRDFNSRLSAEAVGKKSWELGVEEDWGMIRLWGPKPHGLMYLGAKR